MEDSHSGKCDTCGSCFPEGSRFCPSCGAQVTMEVLQKQQTDSGASGKPASDMTSGIRLLGVIVGGAGMAIVAYFYLVFSTAVDVPTMHFMGQAFGGGQVNNIGLMAERQNGILVGFGIALLGALVALFYRPSRA